MNEIRDTTTNTSPSEKIQTTDYFDETPVAEAVVPETAKSILRKATDPLPSTQMHHVLSREYQIWSGEWSPLTTSGTNVVTLAIPYAIAKNVYFADLLSRYAYIRWSSIEITVRVNSTPFHFGALMMSWINGEGYASFDDTFNRRCNNNPHILNVSEGTVVKIVVPWESPTAWYALSRAPYPIATTFAFPNLYLDVLVPLEQDADQVQAIDVAIFARFLDPEVQGAVPASVVPVNHYADVIVQGESSEASAKMDAMNLNLPGFGDPNSVIDSLTSLASSTVSLGEKLAPLAALLDKPTTSAPTTLVQQYPNRDLPHVAGISSGVFMGLEQQDSLSADPTIIPAGGELTPGQIAQIPSYDGTTNVAATNLANTLILSRNVNPATNQAGAGYASWASRVFKYWRGSMKYAFYFVTSRFTSMRVRVAWFPNATAAPATFPLEESGDCYSQVFDINGSTVVNFTVPWISQFYYRNLPSFSPDWRNGVIAMYVVNTLVNVDKVVTPHCTIVSYVAGGPDMRFFVMQGDDFQPPLLREVKKEKKPARVHVRATGENADTVDPSCVRLFFSKPFPPITPSEGIFEDHYVTNEPEVSWNEMGKRFAVYEIADDVTVPFPAVPLDFFNKYDFHSYLAAIFMFRRGGMRAKIFPAKGTVAADLKQLYRAYWGSPHGGPMFANTGSLEQFYLDLEIPQVFPLPFAYCPRVQPWASHPGTLPPVQMGDFVASRHLAYYMRAFADTWQFGGIYAPPNDW